PAGYRYVAEPGEVDVLDAELLAVAARDATAAGEHRRAVTVTERALPLWRGDVLGDLGASVALWQPHIRHLEELRRSLVENLVHARFALGQYADAIPPLLEHIG